MGAAEFNRWKIFYAIHPFGEARADFRQAITSHVIAVANGDRTSTVEKWLPKVDALAPKKDRTGEQYFAIAKAMCDSLKGLSDGRN